MMTGQAEREHVIMFADVVGSTRLYENMGDARASALIRERLALLQRVAAQQHGRTVAEIGDEIVCVFDSVEHGANAACEMHAELSDLSATTPVAIKIRIGMHLGGLVAGTDLAGEPARIAQWAARHAKPEQTLVTDQLYRRLPGVYKAVSRFVDDETWNLDQAEHLELYELIWDVEAVTAFKGETVPAQAHRLRSVRFGYGNREILVDDEHPVLSVGRHASNDLVVAHDLVSRQHFSVQFSRGRCTITDNSTNGTFLVTEEGRTVPIRRETFPLHGAGRIYLGEPSEAKAGYAIRYRCE